MVKTPTPANPVTYEELFSYVRGLAETNYSDARMDAANIVDTARALTRRGMSSKPDPAAMKKLRESVAGASHDRPGISEYVRRVSDMHPALAEAADAIFTGDEGRAVLPISNWGVSLCFGWHSNEHRKHFIEWAYIS